MKTLIIGIGNEYRSDDAIGILVARKLKEKKIKDIEIIESDGDGAKLMELWKNFGNVIVIDAVKLDNKPGFIHKINAITDKIPLGISSHSSHLFSVSEAIETSRVLKKLPKKLTIYGIEGEIFVAGTQISREVLSAADEVIDVIVKDMNSPANEVRGSI